MSLTKSRILYNNHIQLLSTFFIRWWRVDIPIVMQSTGSMKYLARCSSVDLFLESHGNLLEFLQTLRTRNRKMPLQSLHSASSKETYTGEITDCWKSLCKPTKFWRLRIHPQFNHKTSAHPHTGRNLTSYWPSALDTRAATGSSNRLLLLHPWIRQVHE